MWIARYPETFYGSISARQHDSIQTCKGDDPFFVGTDPGNSGSMENVGLEMGI